MSLKSARGSVIVIAVGVQLALWILTHLPLFMEHLPWLTTTIATSWLGLVVVVGGVMMLWGGLQLRDLGIDRPASQVTQALVTSAAFWAAHQAAIGGLVVIQHGEWAPNPSLWNGGIFRLLGGLVIEQWLSNALHEELFFRGFLMVQLALILGRGKDAWRPRYLVPAVAISQLLFAMMHLPHLVLNGFVGTRLLIALVLLFLGGVLYASVYLRTRNLLVAVGLHGLFNDPLSLSLAHIDTIQILWGVLVIVLLLVWRNAPDSVKHVAS